MATPLRRQDPALKDVLFQEPYRFDFFQAVRLLEQVVAGSVPVGHDGPPDREVVRFAAHLALHFPPSAIHSLEWPGAGGDDVPPPRMVTPFMGLVGPSGVLPVPYTEELIAPNSRKRAAPAAAFLDLFHHRLVSLFYRAWEKYNVPAQFERGRRAAGVGAVFGDDPFTRRLFDFVGLGLAPLRDRMHLPDASLLFYAGLFAQQHRSAVALEVLLRDYFRCPVAVVTFSGQWLRLEPEQRSRMGKRGAFHRLGVETVAGRKVWDDLSKFRVRIGPLGFEAFRAFLPGGHASDALMDLIRFFVRAEFDFDVQLILRAEEVPACRLARDPKGASQLGRFAWLKRKEFIRDAEDAVFKPGR
jgi:type VI secretion system protein ImpH